MVFCYTFVFRAIRKSECRLQKNKKKAHTATTTSTDRSLNETVTKSVQMCELKEEAKSPTDKVPDEQLPISRPECGEKAPEKTVSIEAENNPVSSTGAYGTESEDLERAVGETTAIKKKKRKQFMMLQKLSTEKKVALTGNEVGYIHLLNFYI